MALELANDHERQSAKVIGALSSQGNYHYWVQEEYFDKADILQFMKRLVKVNKNKNWGVFWDNCRTHHARVVKNYLEE